MKRPRGRPPLDRTKGRLNATIDRELYDLLREEAESETDGNVSRLIEQILDTRYHDRADRTG